LEEIKEHIIEIEKRGGKERLKEDFQWSNEYGEGQDTSSCNRIDLKKLKIMFLCIIERN
ncbi:hypothetical protein ACJX0J_037189, partial [Zea mays]